MISPGSLNHLKVNSPLYSVHVDRGPGRGLDAAGHLSEALCWRAEASWTFSSVGPTERRDQEGNEAGGWEIDKQGL